MVSLTDKSCANDLKTRSVEEKKSVQNQLENYVVLHTNSATYSAAKNGIHPVAPFNTPNSFLRKRLNGGDPAQKLASNDPKLEPKSPGQEVDEIYQSISETKNFGKKRSPDKNSPSISQLISECESYVKTEEFTKELSSKILQMFRENENGQKSCELLHGSAKIKEKQKLDEVEAEELYENHEIKKLDGSLRRKSSEMEPSYDEHYKNPRVLKTLEKDHRNQGWQMGQSNQNLPSQCK